MVEFDISKGVKDFMEAVQNQSRMTHSGIVLAGAAILDNQLERAIKATMKPLPNKLYMRLFDSFGPLSTFASKVVMARALGIITIEAYDELEKIRDIRNDFAHSSTILNFESPEIAPKVLSLKKPKGHKPKHASGVFVSCVTCIYESLATYLVDKSHEQAKPAF